MTVNGSAEMFFSAPLTDDPSLNGTVDVDLPGTNVSDVIEYLLPRPTSTSSPASSLYATLERWWYGSSSEWWPPQSEAWWAADGSSALLPSFLSASYEAASITAALPEIDVGSVAVESSVDSSLQSRSSDVEAVLPRSGGGHAPTTQSGEFASGGGGGSGGFWVPASTSPQSSTSLPPEVAPSDPSSSWWWWQESSSSAAADGSLSSSWLDWLSNVTADYDPLELGDAVNVTASVADFTNLTMGAGGGWLTNVTGPGTDVVAAASEPTGPIEAPPGKEYWALVLILFPLFTVFGNVLVILSVYKERNLHTVTNYFIVSLAVADLLVAALVMPFAVYVLVNGSWELSPTLCDFYIAMDVTCSTSSIFNLVAISIDRFIAVTQPIKYAKHKNNQRVVFTIAIVWLVSAAIGSPIVLGLNTSPDRDNTLCVFYNSDFIIYSSLSSFYIPCIIMVFLYYRIFKAIRARAQKSAATKTPHRGEMRPDTVIENVANAKYMKPAVSKRGRHALCRYKYTVTLCVTSFEPDHPTATNTESGSQENEEEEGDVEEQFSNTDCQVIQNDQSTEFILGQTSDDGKSGAPPTTSTTVSAPSAPFSTYLSVGPKDPIERNGNHDSGYGLSNVEETTFQGSLDEEEVVALQCPKRIERRKSGGSTHSHRRRSSKRNGTAGGVLATVAGCDRQGAAGENFALKTGVVVQQQTDDGTLSPGPRKKPRFHLARTHKSSSRKREKSAAKKERKATKTLAIVLGVFLACWVPFFTCNILDAICLKLEISEWKPKVTVFLLTTWLGYMNSFINPVIYTIFNPEFRKAFKKILFGN